MDEIITLNIIVSSFADGTRRCFLRKQLTEDDVLAQALWLENHDHVDEAERFLDKNCWRVRQ